ncbi:MAG: protein-glutamine gamma-glutamyltransferase [Solirubrobacteraceae bacterium]|nr:protein-glutamine gamma-glutamyltransferase [Solirubrobacteraceae bacterium]
MSIAGWVAGSALAGPARIRGRTDRRLPVAVARVPAFALLAAFAAHRWGQMVGPAASGAVRAWLVAAVVGAALLIAVARLRRGPWPRALATLLVAVALLVVAFAAAGVPHGFAGPRAWDDLAAGIGQGLGAVPSVHVPYDGADVWTRIVIVLGGGTLVALAAVLAFVPRRGGVFGFPLAAAVALATLYLVPVMQHDGAHQFLDGSAFALLLALMLWLEHVELRGARVAAGAVLAALLAALAIAPALDGDRALLDYEHIAQSLSPGPITRYDWNHSYGPLDWPRDGREVLRIQADDRAYWKAANLTVFDGRRWVTTDGAPGAGLEGLLEGAHPEWRQTLWVTVRALSSPDFVAAGATIQILGSPRTPVLSGAGVYSTQDQPLLRGSNYRAVVYTPRPTERALRLAARLPLPAITDATGMTTIALPAPLSSSGPAERVTIPAWGEGDPAPNVVAAIDASPYRRAYALARQLRAGAASPYEFVLAIERHLAGDYRYSESPRRAEVPLDDFLFDARAGYCQQFSGAMALLLRLGGVPARVAAGFTPGVLDAKRHEWVVRDVDAHSWVEVFFPGIGWVTRDPTPGASPARSQITDLRPLGPRPAAALPDATRTPLAQRQPELPVGVPAPQRAQHGSPVLLVVALALGGALAALGVLLAVRRRRRRAARAGDDPGEAQLAELHRALRRSGRSPSPQTTLGALAARYRDTAAEGYLRVLTATRYGYGGARPTPAERAGLRRELASGLGVLGWLRAWWALPPHMRR